MLHTGLDTNDLYDSGESDCEMSSLSEDSDVDEYSAQQKTDMKCLNKRVERRLLRKPERFKEMEVRRSLRARNNIDA